jgi:hypothetical protein
MEQENECSKAFYALAVNIRKTRMLERSRRQQEGAVYLEKTYAQYMTLMEKSNLLSGSIKDKFMELPKPPKPPKNKKKPPDSSSSSGNSTESPLPKEDMEDL